MRPEELFVVKQDSYQEGFLHAITQCKLHSLGNINSILHEALAEEGFEDFNDTQNITREWTEGQREMLKSAYIRKL